MCVCVCVLWGKFVVCFASAAMNRLMVDWYNLLKVTISIHNLHLFRISFKMHTYNGVTIYCTGSHTMTAPMNQKSPRCLQLEHLLHANSEVVNSHMQPARSTHTHTPSVHCSGDIIRSFNCVACVLWRHSGIAVSLLLVFLFVEYTYDSQHECCALKLHTLLNDWATKNLCGRMITGWPLFSWSKRIHLHAEHYLGIIWLRMNWPIVNNALWVINCFRYNREK